MRRGPYRHEPYDQRATGGCLAFGVRTIRKGGRILFDGWTYHHPVLEKFEGHRVECSGVDDIWVPTKIQVSHPTLGELCWAKNVTGVSVKTPERDADT